MLSGDSNLPPTHDEEMQGKGETEKRSAWREGVVERGNDDEGRGGGAVPSSGAEKCCST